MLRSLSRRSREPGIDCSTTSRACWGESAGITRYPRVSNRKVRTESACSLSSTQRIVFFGRKEISLLPMGRNGAPADRRDSGSQVCDPLARVVRAFLRSGPRRFGRVVDSPLPGEADRRDKALLSAPRGNSGAVRRIKAEPQGREMLALAQVARRGSSSGKESVCVDAALRSQTKMARKSAVCAGSDDALGRLATVQQSSVSQLRLSVIQAKDLSATRSHVACGNIVNVCQEYEETARSAMAKLERKEKRLKLAHPPASESARIH